MKPQARPKNFWSHVMETPVPQSGLGRLQLGLEYFYIYLKNLQSDFGHLPSGLDNHTPNFRNLHLAFVNLLSDLKDLQQDLKLSKQAS